MEGETRTVRRVMKAAFVIDQRRTSLDYHCNRRKQEWPTSVPVTNASL